jgi:VWFA-related protein
MYRRLLVTTSIAAALAATLVAGQAPQAPADTPPLTFRAEVNYVEVDTVVTDNQGNAVTDLTVDDFEVREDGRPQEVTAFAMVNLPIERPERPLFGDAPIEPDVQSNAAVEGRIYAIVLDDLHTRFTNTIRVKQALRTFIEERFGSNDLAAVVYTSGRVSAGQEFTNNPRLLLAAIDKFSGRNLRSEALEINDGDRVWRSESVRPVGHSDGSARVRAGAECPQHAKCLAAVGRVHGRHSGTAEVDLVRQ